MGRDHRRAAEPCAQLQQEASWLLPRHGAIDSLSRCAHVSHVCVVRWEGSARVPEGHVVRKEKRSY